MATNCTAGLLALDVAHDCRGLTPSVPLQWSQLHDASRDGPIAPPRLSEVDGAIRPFRRALRDKGTRVGVTRIAIHWQDADGCPHVNRRAIGVMAAQRERGAPCVVR